MLPDLFACCLLSHHVLAQDIHALADFPLLRLLGTPTAIGDVFNIGSNEEVSMMQLAEMVRDAAGSKSEIKLIPYSEAYPEGFEDMMRRVPDVTKLERTINFRPKTPLSKIIEDVVADQRANLAGR